MCNTIVMRRESLEKNGLFEYYAPRIEMSLGARAEMLSPCGRFRQIQTTEERVARKLLDILSRIDAIQSNTLVAQSGTPINWLRLLDYLHERGIIGAPYFAPRTFGNDLPKLASAALYPPVRAENADGNKVSYSGYSTARSIEEAMSKAVGEMLERHFLTQYRQNSLLIDTPARLHERGAIFLDPANLNRFLPWQIKQNPLFERSRESTFSWVSGTELFEGKGAYIPAQLVFWNYARRLDPPENILADQTTSGAAGHFTRNEALLSALLELIERDGFLVYWLNSLSPRVVDVASSRDPDIIALLEYAKRYRLELFFLNTSTEMGVPSLTSVVVDRAGDGPVISIGGGTGFDFKEIVLRSALEALSVHNSSVRGETIPVPKNYEPFTRRDIQRSERLHIWRGKMMYERFAFFLAGSSQSPKDFIGDAETYTSANAQLEHILGTLREMGPGYEPYAYEVRNDVLSTLGYHVVRVIVPQLVPLYLKENMATLDARRLREAPGRLGYTPASSLNPWPHPFP